jgi:hypothetical protein
MNWKTYCRKHGIRYEYEGPFDVRFTAPKGTTFGNGSRHRLVEDLEQLLDYEGPRAIEGMLLYT